MKRRGSKSTVDQVAEEILRRQEALNISAALARGLTPREAGFELGVSTQRVNRSFMEELAIVRQTTPEERAEIQTAPEPADEDSKRGRALELKKRGYSNPQIEEALHTSRGWAARVIPEELARLEAATIRNTDQVRALQIARLEGLLKPLEEEVDRGDVPSINAALQVVKEINKIEGTYAPVKVDVDERIRILAVQLNVDEEELMAEARQLAKEYALRALNNG